MASKRLMTELKQHRKEPYYFYSLCPKESILEWDFTIIGPPDSLYEYGIFNGVILFPTNYPISPPMVKFKCNMNHPNIYSNGILCISILHEGVDQYGYEEKSERWNPSHGIDSIMLSILTLLSEPNFDSPADVEVSKLYRNNYELYKKQIYDLVLKSQY